MRPQVSAIIKRVKSHARPTAIAISVLAALTVGGIVLSSIMHLEPAAVEIADPTPSPRDGNVTSTSEASSEESASAANESTPTAEESSFHPPPPTKPEPPGYVPPPIGGEGQQYMSFISNEALVEDDTNKLDDIYRGGGPGGYVLVSVSDSEEIANGGSEASTRAISRDGRYVVFWSAATNLTTEKRGGLFVRDLLNGTTKLVRPMYEGEEVGMPVTPSIETALSGDGRHIAFSSPGKIFVHHLDTGVTEIGGMTSSDDAVTAFGREFSLSYIGRFLAFASTEDNVTENSCDTSDCGQQVYLRDLKEGRTELLSVSPNGRQGNAGSLEYVGFSDDERLTYFWSCATNLTEEIAVPPPTPECGSHEEAHSFTRDIQTNTTTQIS